MKFSDFKNVVDVLKEHKVFFVTISGGEPFLHPDINEILRYAHEKFEYATVLSNGTTINKENLECMKEIINKKGYFPMQVSLDSIDPKTNNKTRGMASNVIENLQILKNTGVSLTIAIVITSQNIEQVIKTIISLKNITKHFHIMPFKSVPFLNREDQYLRSNLNEMQNIWERLEHIRSLHDLKIKLPTDECDSREYSAAGAPCVAGFTQVVIDPDLDVRACSRCTHAVVGNLKNENLKNIWNSSKLAYIYKRNIPFCQDPSEWEVAIKNPDFTLGKHTSKTLYS